MIWRTRRTSLLAILPVTLLALSPLAGAAESDPIAARQMEMEGVGEAMKTLSAIARKQAPFDATVVASQGGAIAAHLDRAKDLFPAGSDRGAAQSWAKAEIWSNRTDFDAKLQAAHAAAGELAQVAEEAAFMPALGKLGNACKACHEPYRRPKE